MTSFDRITQNLGCGDLLAVAGGAFPRRRVLPAS